jgi:cytidine deaminase
MGISLTLDAGFPAAAKGLLELAQRTGKNAYNPYSGYMVGASVETTDGSRFAGTFMENASFGLTICAEPAAILAANSAGRRDIVRMAVVGGNPARPDAGPPCTPCGRCRQIIWESARLNGRDIEMYCADLSMTNILLVTSEELLPYAWGSDNLQ